MKTPFNEEHEPFFSVAGLRRLEFVENQAGSIEAFDMKCVRDHIELDETNSIKICDSQAILPEALELILAAPLLYKSAVRTTEMLDRLINELVSISITSGTPYFKKIADRLEQVKVVAMNAQTVPVIGRVASIQKRGIQG